MIHQCDLARFVDELTSLWADGSSNTKRQVLSLCANIWPMGARTDRLRRDLWATLLGEDVSSLSSLAMLVGLLYNVGLGSVVCD